MNKIYDFGQIAAIRIAQRRLIWRYAAYLLVFAAAVVLLCACIGNHVLLTLVFFALVSGFVLYSIVFWKIKYGILQKHRTFLDNLESGKRDDYVGVFEEKACASSDELFDTYVFSANGKRTVLLIHRQYPVCFFKEKTYHIERIGNYIDRWEMIG